MTVKFKRLGDFVEALAFRVTKAPPASPAANTLYKSLFYKCSLLVTSTQTGKTTFDSYVPVEWDSADVDVGGWWESGTPQNIVVPAAGVVVVSAFMTSNLTGAATSDTFPRVYNATQGVTMGQQREVRQTSQVTHWQSVTAALQCAKNDIIRFEQRVVDDGSITSWDLNAGTKLTAYMLP